MLSRDLSELGPLVALVGRNGQGKTTVLEAVAAALYKELPSRPGSLYEHCHGRDAFVEAVFDDQGSEVKVRVQIDVEGRKTEGYVFVDGAPVTTGRAAEFEAEIERRFGSAELFLASAFSAQNRAGNFLLMPKSERKSLFVELLGLGHLEALQATAKDRRARGDQELAGARVLRGAAENEAGGLPETEQRLAVAGDAADAAAHALEAARAEEAAATSALERAKAAGPRLAALEQAAGAARREEASTGASLDEAQRLAGRAEADTRQKLRAIEAQDLDGQERRATERHQSGCSVRASRLASAEENIKHRPEILAAVAALPEVVSERDILAAAEKLAEDKRLCVSRDEHLLEAGKRRLADAGKTAQRDRERLERQAELLGQVPCTKHVEWEPSDSGPLRVPLSRLCPLLADARESKAAAAAVVVDAEIAHEVETLTRNVELARKEDQEATLACDSIRLLWLQQEIEKLEAMARRAPLLEEASRQIDAIAGEAARAEAEFGTEVKRLREARANAQTRRGAIEAELQDALKNAAARAAAAAKAHDSAVARADAAGRELAAAKAEGTQRVPQAEADLSSARSSRMAAESKLRTADQERAAFDARVAALREKAETVPALRDAEVLAQLAVGDWSLLEKALGKDGVQALEIDAAGPEVARLCNDLLEACYGPRFAVSFETLREKRSARGEFSEAFEVRVYDGGTERSVEALSGGERVIVGEAIGLALAIFNSRKSGIRWASLFRDETAGALDSENAAAYVDLLRRALALGGFAQVLFVSHSPEVFERADSRLIVADGQVRPEAVLRSERRPVAVPA